MYNVQILSDAEFEALPYPETEISLGIADPKTNTAYVRYQNSPEALNYLVNHEVEHLIEGHGGEHSDHYRNGVYYKGAGGFLGMLAPLLSFIPGIGPLLSAGAGIGSGLMGQKEQAKQQRSFQQGGYGNQGNFSGGNQPATQFMPSQSGPAAPSVSIGQSEGASPSTGALGQQPTGSQVDRLRPDFGISSEEAFRRSKGYGLGGS